MPQINKNIGSAIKCLAACAGRLVAAGTGDTTKVTGETIDRMPAGSPGYNSCVIAVTAEAVLADTKTLALAIELQESADDSNWDTAEVLQASTVLLTGKTGGTTEQGCVEIDVDLSGRKKYVRFNVSPDLSAANTDTAHWGATAILGGSDTIPV